MFKTDYENNCYSCMMESLVLVGSIVGLSPFALRCTHDKLQKCDIKEPRTLPVISLAMTLLLLSTTCLEFYNFIRGTTNFDNAQATTQMIRSNIKFCSSISMLLLLSNKETAVETMRNTISALEYADYIGRSALLPKKMIKTIRTQLSLFILCQFSLSLGLFINDVFTSNSANALYGMGVYVWAISYYYMYEIVRFYHVLVKELYSDIKKTIEYRFKYGILKNDKNARLFTEELLKMLRIRKMIYYSMQHYIKFLGPTALILITSQITILILIQYETVIIILDQKFSILRENYSYTITILSAFTFSLIGYRASYECQDLADTSEAMLSYLYRVPLMKLKRDERQQILNLLNIISVQRFIIKPSAIVTVSFKLYASSIYTAISYLMVAVQMHIMAEK